MVEAGRPLVIVTRPRAEAEPLAARIAARGYDVLIEPLLEIEPLPVSLPPAEDFSALVFTSANGARAFARISGERHIPAYAVGTRTEAVLREAGFRDVRCRSVNAAELSAAIAAEMPGGARLLHAAGRVVAADLGVLLAPAGIQVERVALYDAVAAESLSDSLVGAMYACTVHSVLLFSARTAEIFGTLVSRRSLTEWCRTITALCLSPAVAASAASLPWTRTVAAAPTADAMMDLLPAAEP